MAMSLPISISNDGKQKSGSFRAEAAANASGVIGFGELRAEGYGADELEARENLQTSLRSLYEQLRDHFDSDYSRVNKA